MHVLFFIVLTLLTHIKTIYNIICLNHRIVNPTNLCPQGPSHPLSAPCCPNSAPPNSSAAGAASVWVWRRDVTCAETVPTARTRATAVSPETHLRCLYVSWSQVRCIVGLRGLFVSCSRLYSVSLDVLESVQCVVWSGVSFPPEEHPERRPAGGVLRRRTVRQPRVFPAGLSRYKLNTHNAL